MSLTSHDDRRTAFEHSMRDQGTDVSALRTPNGLGYTDHQVNRAFMLFTDGVIYAMNTIYSEPTPCAKAS